MGSHSFSNATDNRMMVEDLPALEKLTAPNSAMSDPLGISIQRGDHSSGGAVEIAYGDVTYNAYPEEFNDLVKDIMSQSVSASQAAMTSVSDTTGTMTDIVEDTKAPLAQYMPYVILVVIVILVLKTWKK